MLSFANSTQQSAAMPFGVILIILITYKTLPDYGVSEDLYACRYVHLVFLFRLHNTFVHMRRLF